MIFDSLRERSPAAKNNFPRKGVPVDLKAGEMELNGEGAKEMNIRREIMKLRRIRALQANSNSAGDPILYSDYDLSLKKRRSEIQKESKLIENENVQFSTSGVTCRSHGLISVIGRRRQMEDAVAVELGFLTEGKKSYDFFGVYDGHGGCHVAHACREMLHTLLVKIVAEESCEGIIDWEKVMIAGFKKMDEEVNKKGTAVATIGSTAVVAVVGDEEVVVANCGDSRAVISRGGVAVQLLDDHKPDRPDELERIELSGGKVINWNGHRVLGVLATSRSIGDQYLKPFVISEPEVRVINRTDTDEFLILASDGLWDVISNDLACKVARRCLNGKLRRNSRLSRVEENNNNNNIEGDSCFEETLNKRNRAFEAAAFLAEFAIGRGSKDNISVTVVELKRSASCGSVGSS